MQLHYVSVMEYVLAAINQFYTMSRRWVSARTPNENGRSLTADPSPVAPIKLSFCLTFQERRAVIELGYLGTPKSTEYA